jgi:hypothetical protein
MISQVQDWIFGEHQKSRISMDTTVTLDSTALLGSYTYHDS